MEEIDLQAIELFPIGTLFEIDNHRFLAISRSSDSDKCLISLCDGEKYALSTLRLSSAFRFRTPSDVLWSGKCKLAEVPTYCIGDIFKVGDGDDSDNSHYQLVLVSTSPVRVVALHKKHLCRWVDSVVVSDPHEIAKDELIMIFGGITNIEKVEK